MPYAETPQINLMGQSNVQQIPTATPQQGSLNVPQFIQQARQQGVPDQQIYQYLQQNNSLPSNQPMQPTQEGAQLHDTGSFLGNLGNSAGNFIGGLVHTVAHPIQTVENLGRGAMGLVEQGLNKVTGNNVQDQNTQIASNIENFFKQRYGGFNNIKTTVYQDPVGFLGDLSTLLSGAGGVIGKAGELSDVSKLSDTGNLLGKAGEVTNPINIAGKVINNPVTRGVTDFAGRQVANALGTSTGAGGSSVQEVFNQARAGSNETISAARGGVSAETAVQTAQDALDNLKQAKNTTYQQQLGAVKGVQGEMDYMPAVEEFKNQLANNGIVAKGDTLDFENARGFQNPSEQAVLQNAYNKISRWGDIPQNNTLYGLDTLKQQLGDFIEQSSGKAKPVISAVKGKLSEILKTNNEYKNLVEPYETTSKLIDEMKTVVAKNPETALKRLTKAVSQDNEYRQSLIDQLSKYTPNGEDLKAQLSGINLQSFVNKSKFFTTFEGLGVLLHPSLLPMFLASSPRVVAEFMNGLGWSASKIDKGLSILKAYKASQITNTASRLNKSTNRAPTTPKQSRTILLKPLKS